MIIASPIVQPGWAAVIDGGVARAMVAKYFYEAEPHWPEDPHAPDGAPNVIVGVLDDVGFAQLGCYGSDIATPHIDALAAEGLQYTNFHTTALCSASRASLLTGRNHHRNGMGRVIELATGFPGYNARIPRSSGFLSEVLLTAGYATMAAGKWHLTPEEECHAGASRRRWPLGRGFERFYGFMSGETHQFAPTLYRDNHILRNADVVTDGYHLTNDLVGQAVQFVTDVRSAAPEKPYFLYFCTGACHSPHQAPQEWIEAYRGRFSAGWDAWRKAAFARQRDLGIFGPGAELSPRPEWVPAWSSLSPDEQRLYARYMEAFAGYLSHTDAALGDLFVRLRALGGWDNTLVVLLSDNGASSEGGPTGSLNDLGPWNRMTAGSLETALAHIDEIGGPYLHNNYPSLPAQQLSLGLDGRGKHAVPAVEAGGPRGRSRRSAHHPLAATGRPARSAAAVRPRRRYHADDSRRRRGRAADSPGRDRPERTRRPGLLRQLRRQERAQPPAPAVLRDVRFEGSLQRGLESGHVPRFRRGLGAFS